MAAAVLAAELGVATVLIDENPSPGGQIYRGIDRPRRSSPLGDDFLTGRPLAAALQASPVDPAGGGSLASRSRRHAIFREWRAQRDIDRASRHPGDRRARKAGADSGLDLAGRHHRGRGADPPQIRGPCPGGPRRAGRPGAALYLLATQLAAAGAPPIAILETTTPENRLEAAGRLSALWAGRRMLLKGLRLILAVRARRRPGSAEGTGLACRRAAKPRPRSLDWR